MCNLTASDVLLLNEFCRDTNPKTDIALHSRYLPN
ncbi:hypothetical protein CPS_0033 [Colwellia psychrerythraea 34H]|uniref:Uncharacterized protein n=1 Tax=Colwellia psychrerythraea (strain 34H / ATCC BAA-681) TaxID=167879 RepID=Q48AV2_COLP3|nr:hypothetical protein CPS_0033 [Colwellia psychrerythraea 34H]